MSSLNTKLTKAFLIVGPESSGNRMMAQSFDSVGVSNACIKNGKYISGPHSIDYNNNPLSVSRSMPYNGQWFDILKLYRDLQLDGEFDTVYLITLDRQTEFMANSQIVQGRVIELDRAYINIERARNYIESTIRLLSFEGAKPIRIQYEDFVTSSKYRKEIFTFLGLPEPTLEYFNANEQGI